MTKDYDPDALKASYIMAGLDYAAPSPTNPRKTFPADKMAELTESVKKHGVMQPIIVRLWPAKYPQPLPTTTYEIVAGERRYRAAKAAGLTMIEAKLRELTDAEALEIQLIENVQREDLHPLEKATNYRMLMDEHGYSADLLAERIGKSRSYIFAQLKLLDLDEDSRRLFEAGMLNASTALLIARIPSSGLRARAIKDITDPYYGGEPMSVRHAQRHIRDRYMLELAKATFPLDDATLTAAGSCATCPKRTGNTPELFADIDSPDVCTDPDCHTEKKIAHRDREAEKARDAGIKVIIGEEAEKITRGYAIEKFTDLRGFTQADIVCHDDPEKRTYAQILAGDVEQVLIEDPVKKTMVPVIDNKVLAEKLQAAGVKLRATEEAKAKAKADGKIKLERRTREIMFEKTRAAVSNLVETPDSWLPEDMEMILVMVAIRMWERSGQDIQFKVADLWGAVGKNQTDRAAALGLIIPSMEQRDAWKLLVDILIISGTQVTSEWDLEHGGKSLLHLHENVFGLNPAVSRKLAQEELAALEAAARPAKKSGKKAAKTADSTPAEVPPTPLKAALAAGTDGAKSETAAQASETSAPESETPPAEAGDNSASDEADAKQSAAEQPAEEFKKGDICEIVNHRDQSLNGKRVVIAQCGDGAVFAFDDAPVTYKTNRAGKRVVDSDPRSIQTVYCIENLKKVAPDKPAEEGRKVGDYIKIRETSKNWRAAGQDAKITLVVGPGIYKAKYGPNICDVTALVEAEILKGLPAGTKPSWLKEEQPSAPGGAEEERRLIVALGEVVRVKKGAANENGIQFASGGLIGRIVELDFEGGIVVMFDHGEEVFDREHLEPAGDTTGRCDKTVDMFQGEAA
jgi:ParB/RepB/Spo0J family partition protein